jgi:fucose permease
VLAGVLGAMAVAFFLTGRAWNDTRSNPGAAQPPQSAGEPPFGAALRSPRVWLHRGAFFVYTGLESSVGQWCFTLLREARGLGVDAAGSWTAAFWGSLTIGRVVLGFVADRLGPDRLLRGATLVIVAGALAFGTSDGALGRVGLLLMGFGLAHMYPTLMARTPARVGPALDRHTIGFEVSAATLGSTCLPSLVGVLVGRNGYAAIGGVAVALSLLLLAAHEALLRLKAPFRAACQ